MMIRFALESGKMLDCINVLIFCEGMAFVAVMVHVRFLIQVDHSIKLFIFTAADIICLALSMAAYFTWYSSIGLH